MDTQFYKSPKMIEFEAELAKLNLLRSAERYEISKTISTEELEAKYTVATEELSEKTHLLNKLSFYKDFYIGQIKKCEQKQDKENIIENKRLLQKVVDRACEYFKWHKFWEAQGFSNLDFNKSYDLLDKEEIEWATANNMSFSHVDEKVNLMGE